LGHCGRADRVNVRIEECRLRISLPWRTSASRPNRSFCQLRSRPRASVHCKSLECPLRTQCRHSEVASAAGLQPAWTGNPPDRLSRNIRRCLANVRGEPKRNGYLPGQQIVSSTFGHSSVPWIVPKNRTRTGSASRVRTLPTSSRRITLIAHAGRLCESCHSCAQ
jgi:hypothetical protein